jgi:hypothetical protein
MSEPTPNDLYEAMQRIRRRLEGEFVQAMDSKGSVAKRLVQIEQEMVAADRALDFYMRQREGR